MNRSEVDRLLTRFVRRLRVQTALIRFVEALAIILIGFVVLATLGKTARLPSVAAEAGFDCLIAAALIRVLPAIAHLLDPRIPATRAAMRLERFAPYLQQRLSTLVSVNNPNSRFAEQLSNSLNESLRSDPLLTRRASPWSPKIYRMGILLAITIAAVLIGLRLGANFWTALPAWHEEIY